MIVPMLSRDTQDICNKFLEINFCVGCMVSQPNRLQQRSTTMSLINKMQSKQRQKNPNCLLLHPKLFSKGVQGKNLALGNQNGFYPNLSIDMETFLLQLGGLDKLEIHSWQLTHGGFQTRPYFNPTKGQIISKWFFGVFDFLQKTNENKST